MIWLLLGMLFGGIVAFVGIRVALAIADAELQRISDEIGL